jgi:predicted homoserine dehydrogenase-like protein
VNKVNVGVIGVGAMGYNHARVYYRLEEANLMAISDITKGTLAKVSKKYDTQGFVDYENILEMPEIEVVSVCVPTTHHYNVVMDAIDHGKHVLVEKPIAFTLEEAKEMVKAAKEKGVDSHAMSGIDFDGIHKEFGLKESEVVVMLVTLGYYDASKALYPRRPRRLFEDIATVI